MSQATREGMTASVIAWIERSVGPAARVMNVEALPESATAKHIVDVTSAGSTQRLVLRRYYDAKRLASDPWYAPANEAMTLRLLADSAVPAPRLHATDIEATVCEVPALLESWVSGDPGWQLDELDLYLARAAEVLVSIHSVSVPSDVQLPRYARYEARRPVTPEFSSHPGLWERVADVLAAPPPPHRDTFIHRDYHPGNVLWDGARVTGVVDWATAAWGPPGIDLARMRLNLATHPGRAAADHFVAAYVAAGGDASARDPYWDLLDAADVLPDLTSSTWLTGGDFGRLEEYVEGVVAECRERT